MKIRLVSASGPLFSAFNTRIFHPGPADGVFRCGQIKIPFASLFGGNKGDWMANQVFRLVIFRARLYWLKGVPLFLRRNPNRCLTGSFAFAHSGKLLSYLLDTHSFHLLSTPLGHNIEKDPVEKYPLEVWL